MKSSELNKFFRGNLKGKELSALIEIETSLYGKLMEKKGSSIPLVFVEDEPIIINKEGIEKLMQETMVENLTNIQLAYICDCLTLGEMVEYENEISRDTIFEIADPEINGGYKSKEEIKRLNKNLL